MYAWTCGIGFLFFSSFDSVMQKYALQKYGDNVYNNWKEMPLEKNIHLYIIIYKQIPPLSGSATSEWENHGCSLGIPQTGGWNLLFGCFS